MTVLMWVPLPPPFAGPEVASQQLVAAIAVLRPDIRVESATLRASNRAKGRFDLTGLLAFARAYRRFLVAAKQAETVYLVAAANRVGSARDALLIASARALGKRIVLHLRGGRYAEFYAESGVVEREMLRRAWGAADHAIVQTPHLRDQLATAAPHVPVTVIPNGLAGVDYPEKQSYARGGPRLLFVGHLAYAKGFLTLVRAFQRLRETYPEATLVCAGELAESEATFATFLPVDQRPRYLAERYAIADEIRLALCTAGIEYAGVVTGPRKAALFRDADVFVLPSYTEGFSLALLEAMFHGLAVVATRTGGTPDVIVESEQGLLVEPGDEDALAAALARIAGTPALREQMGRRNAKVARERYELVDVARSVVELFETLDSTNTARFAASGSGSSGAKRA